MNIGLVGYGKTGQMVKKAVDETEGVECTGIVSSKHMHSLSDFSVRPDVIIDFSHPSNLEMIRLYAEENQVALVLGTTGYEPQHLETIKAVAQKVPVVYTSNFSLGITVFQQVLKQITPALRDAFDIELIEKHHSAKLDAPSGTAKMLLAVMDEGKEYRKVYGRKGLGRRGEEIGVHSVRGGSIAGEHTVLFAGEDEIFEISHRASSNRIFANGAIQAAHYVACQRPGLYNMSDVLFPKERPE